MNRFLLSLWLAGAVLYAVSTLLSNDVVNPFGDDRDGLNPVMGTATSSSTGRNAAERASPRELGLRSEQGVNINRQASPHAITPAIPSSGRTGAEFEPVSSTDRKEILIVTSAASIRDGPSNDAKIVGTVQPGAQVQVARRESDWVHFDDFVSGRSGWIHAAALEPRTADEGTPSAAPPPTPKQLVSDEIPEAKPEEAEAPPGRREEPPEASPTRQTQPDSASANEDVAPHPRRSKNNLATKDLEKARELKPKDQASRPAPPRLRGRTQEYVGFPPDEKFVPPRKRRFGILSRRRMWRDAPMPPSWRDAYPPPSRFSDR